MRALAVIALSLFVLSGHASAQSKCDADKIKAGAKKFSCKAGIVAKARSKGVIVDSAKFAACDAKFGKSCTKAESGADCTGQTPTCAAIELYVDNSLRTFACQPSGAPCDLTNPGACCSGTCVNGMPTPSCF
jgi:hypothetical protein